MYIYVALHVQYLFNSLNKDPNRPLPQYHKFSKIVLICEYIYIYMIFSTYY